MIAQLRAARTGSAVIRNTWAIQRTQLPCGLSLGTSNISVSSLYHPIRFASDYRSSGRSNTFGLKQRDGGDGGERKPFERRPASFGSQRRDRDDDTQNRPRRRNDDEATDRSPYRPRSAQGEARGYQKTDRSDEYPRREYDRPARAFSGERRDAHRNSFRPDRTEYRRPERAFDSEKRDASGNKPWQRSKETSDGYVKRDKPAYGKPRGQSKESADGGK
jgi:hypothetical protein